MWLYGYGSAHDLGNIIEFIDSSLILMRKLNYLIDFIIWLGFLLILGIRYVLPLLVDIHNLFYRCTFVV